MFHETSFIEIVVSSSLGFRVTDEVSMSISFLINIVFALKGTHFYFLFAITAPGVVPCGGPKSSVHHP